MHTKTNINTGFYKRECAASAKATRLIERQETNTFTHNKADYRLIKIYSQLSTVALWHI